MKKMLRKTVAIALIACMCLAAVPMMASAYALTADMTFSGTVATVSGTAQEGSEVAVVVVECTHETTGDCTECDLETMKDDAVYVNQVTAGANGAYSFTINGLDNQTKYTAFVGAAGADAQVKTTYEGTVTPTQIKYGDLDMNGSIGSGDLSQLVQMIGQVRAITGNAALAADLDGNESIGSGDLSRLVQVLGQVRAENALGKDGASEFVPVGSVVRDADGNVVAELLA